MNNDTLIVWGDGVKARIRGGKVINSMSYQVCCAGGGCVMCNDTPSVIFNDQSFCSKCQHDYMMIRRMYFKAGLESVLEMVHKRYAQKTKEHTHKFKNGKFNKRSLKC